MIDNIFRIRDIAKELKLAEPNIDTASVFRTLCETAKRYPTEDVTSSEVSADCRAADDTIRERILTLARQNNVRLNCDALDLPESMRPFTLGVVLPSDYGASTEAVEATLRLAAKLLGVDVRVIVSCIPHSSDGGASCSAETLYAILNSLRKENTDVYMLAAIDSPAFAECLETLGARKPVIIFDGAINLKVSESLADCAVIAPDYYSLGQVAALAVDNVVSSTDFLALVTSNKNDVQGGSEKSPLVAGYLRGIERLTALNKPDVAMFYTERSIHRTPQRLASSYGNYYGVRRDELNRLAIEKRTQVNGLGVVFANTGDLAVSIDALLSLDSTFDRFIGKTIFVGVNDNITRVPYKLTERINVFVSVDLYDHCCLAIACAARRLAVGKFETKRLYPKCLLTKKYLQTENNNEPES